MIQCNAYRNNKRIMINKKLITFDLGLARYLFLRRVGSVKCLVFHKVPPTNFFEIHLTQFRRIITLQKLHSWKHFRNSFLNIFLEDFQEHAPGQALGIQSLLNSLYAGFKTIAKVNFSEFFWKMAHSDTYGRCRENSVIFHQRSSSIEGCLLSKVVFFQRSSSIEGCLPSNVIFRQMLSSVKGCLPSKLVFRQRSSSVKGRLSSKVLFR